MDDNYHCFRCKGLAVVDPTILRDLLPILYRAAEFIDKRDDTPEVALALIESLRDYAILIESMPDD